MRVRSIKPFKAIAIAKGYLEGDRIDIVCVPRFVEIEISGQERTAMRFGVESREMPDAAFDPQDQGIVALEAPIAGQV